MFPVIFSWLHNWLTFFQFFPYELSVLSVTCSIISIKLNFLAGTLFFQKLFCWWQPLTAYSNLMALFYSSFSRCAGKKKKTEHKNVQRSTVKSSKKGANAVSHLDHINTSNIHKSHISQQLLTWRLQWYSNTKNSLQKRKALYPKKKQTQVSVNSEWRAEDHKVNEFVYSLSIVPLHCFFAF